MSEYTHYIQHETDTQKRNLETSFGDILYSRCDGLNAKGKRKNVYIESSAESDALRVWQGDTVTREATKITLTLYFVGAKRMDAFDALYEYIKNGKFYYWDTARNRKVYCILNDEYKPSEERWYGATPYIAANISLQNLWGESKKCNSNGELL